jgi:CheY-like chemotaxis protein
MLPTRAYADPLPPFSAGARAQPSTDDARPVFVLAVAAPDVEIFPAAGFTRIAARTTTEAIRLIERWRPRVAAIDWDLPDEFDGAAISSAARQTAFTAILGTTAKPERAPAAIKAGSHAVLLKPFSPNLIAARVGRLCREVPTVPAALRAAAALQLCGTNRTWSDMACPTCSQTGAVGFEFASHRRTWYACLACDGVWLGARRE